VRSLEDEEDQESIASLFATPVKGSVLAAGAALSETASNLTTSIWDKLAEENERRARLRAKLEIMTSGVTLAPRTPETVVGSPLSLKTASSSGALSASIDDTLVRLDDILSRTFQFSRSRKSEKVTPEKGGQSEDENCEKEGAVGSPDSNMMDVYLDTSSQLLIPLGDSAVPHSPLREDIAYSFALDGNPFSFLSGGLEDDLNGSLVQTADNASVHSGSGRLLCQDPHVPTSLFDAQDESSVADSDDSEASIFMQFRMPDEENTAFLMVGGNGGTDSTKIQTMVVSPEIPDVLADTTDEDAKSVADNDVRLGIASLSNGSETREGNNSSNNRETKDGDHSSSEDEVEHTSFHSVESSSGHSLV
jgi:hypothetical protein